jgi:hypothetical protein
MDEVAGIYHAGAPVSFSIRTLLQGPLSARNRRWDVQINVQANDRGWSVVA